MTATLAQTPLHAWHVAHGGRMVDFAGWSMPVQYASIVAEHHATRRAAGVFDVSHMARLRVEGPEAEEFLDRVVTRRIAGTHPGQVRYALVTNHEGGILDDVLVYHLAEQESGKSYFIVVANASNRRKITTWLEANQGSAQLEMHDRTHETAMIAVQGPLALEALRQHAAIDPASLKYYHAAETTVAGAPAVLSRTGYTGEDGWEVMLPADAGVELWQGLLDGSRAIASAAGLGCRDTLRLEAAMPLYGHELDEHIDPFQAGLGFAVDLEGRSFPGSDVLAQRKLDPDLPRRVGWEVAPGGRIARQGDEVFADGKPVGHVTSGTFSPTLERAIAMGYVDRRHAADGTAVEIETRGRRQGAVTVHLPFYSRKKPSASPSPNESAARRKS